MTRFEAIALVSRGLTDEPVVASLGHPAYDLFASGDRALNFYTWGSMGLTSSLALGLALARPDRRVVALDGDGSLLMNLGTLATIATAAPPNLVVLVLDNGLDGHLARRRPGSGRARDGHRAHRHGARPRAIPPRPRGEREGPRPLGDRGEGGRIGARGEAAARLRLHQAAVHGGVGWVDPAGGRRLTARGWVQSVYRRLPTTALSARSLTSSSSGVIDAYLAGRRRRLEDSNTASSSM